MEHSWLRQWGAAFGIAIMLAFAQTPDTIATVNGNPISTLAFQQRTRYTRWTIGQQLNQVVQQVGVTALTDPASPYNSQFKLLSDSSAKYRLRFRRFLVIHRPLRPRLEQTNLHQTLQSWRRTLKQPAITILGRLVSPPK